MAKTKFEDLSFIEVYDTFFMQGSNLGNKVNATAKAIKLTKVDDSYVAVYFKGKASFIPLAGIKSADWKEIPEELKEHWGLDSTQQNEMTAPAHVFHTQKKLQESDWKAEDGPTHMSAEEIAHREQVRAASRNSNRPDPVVTQNDKLIQESRQIAVAAKFQGQATSKAQVSTPTQGVQGKPKAISHSQMKAQVAQEMKE